MIRLTESEEREVAQLIPKNREVYILSREQGSPHKFAMMCAQQQFFGGVKTDSTYFATHKSLGEQFQGALGQKDLKHRLQNAKEFYDFVPSKESHYDASMVPPGEHPGHPNAWIGPTDGRGKLEKGMEANRIAAEKVREKKSKETRKRKLAPDLIAQSAREAIAKNPDLARKSKSELTQMMIEKHGSRY